LALVGHPLPLTFPESVPLPCWKVSVPES
jgi:hypothetical protein